MLSVKRVKELVRISLNHNYLEVLCPMGSASTSSNGLHCAYLFLSLPQWMSAVLYGALVMGLLQTPC